ncbi:ArsR/SmtB family transcription factor [Micromonospora trifolii]|uniref:ArsR/SmtB family transcription factor n=1 Tax=Micromonospora trifolii TaxID=2911208 RepID=UPI003D2ECFC5
MFSALADPTRRAILAELADRDATVTELTAPLPISMPAVSRHLKALERAGLISRTRSGKLRMSRIEAAPLREAAEWIERYRRFWDTSLTRLDAHLAAVQAAGRATDRTTHGPATSDRESPNRANEKEN